MAEMADAKTRGWGDGYPTDRRSDMAKITDGNDVTVYVHRAIAPTVAWLMRESERLGYTLHGGWCWGYANRAIRGSTRASNHSWGLAVDLNAPTNPMSSTLRTDMPDWVPALWKAHGFGWGGNYSGRKDAMHYEFLGTPADAQHVAASLGSQVTADQAVKALEEIARRRAAQIEEDDMAHPPYAKESAPSRLYVVMPDGHAEYMANGPQLLRAAAAKLVAVDANGQPLPALVLPDAEFDSYFQHQ